jgi:hypothetical protein
MFIPQKEVDIANAVVSVEWTVQTSMHNSLSVVLFLSRLSGRFTNGT